MSYRRILTPIAALGGVLMLAMVLLGHWVIPRFWEQMTLTIERDITSLLVSAIRKGEACQIEDLQIYADEVRPQINPEGTTADLRLLLVGLVALKTQDRTQPEVEFTAEYATVDVYRRPDATYLKLALGESTTYSQQDGVLAIAPEATPEAIRLVRKIDDSPKYWTWPRMRRFRSEPDVSTAVQADRDALVQKLRELEDWRRITERIARNGSIELADSTGRWRFRVEADEVGEQGNLRRTDDGPVVISEFDQGRATRRAQAAQATLVSEGSTPEGTPIFALLAPDAKSMSLQSGLANVGRWEPRLSALAVVNASRRVINLSTTEALEAADAIGFAAIPGGSRWKDQIDSLEAELRDEIVEKGEDVAARSLQRTAISLTGPLLLLTGAVLAMWRRNSLPLQIYMLAFIPSIIDILLISGGEQLLRNGKPVLGTIVMWSGNGVLLAVLLSAYARLARN